LDASAAGLIQASDGNLYGTTAYGGDADEDGTLFRITTNGTFTINVRLLAVLSPLSVSY